MRLRGHEIDQVDFARKSFGNTYALGKQTNDPRELAKLLMKLCEKTGRRLRKAGYTAQGVHVSCVYTGTSPKIPVSATGLTEVSTLNNEFWDGFGFFLLAHWQEG
jgi:hypothetical protein